MKQAVVATKPVKAMIHIGTGTDLMQELSGLPVKEQKLVTKNYLLEAQQQIADLEENMQKEEKSVKALTKDLKETTLMKKLKAKKQSLNNQRKLKDDLLARYTGAKILAGKLGIINETKQIGEGE